MLKIKFFPYALLALSPSLFAAQPPSAGSQMQQIPPAAIPQQSPHKVEVKPNPTPLQTGSESVKIVVKSLRVIGAKAYPEAELLALTGFKPGSELSLHELRGMATKIADYYHSNGYFVAQAYLPAQDIKDGSVTIAVIDGQYGKITLNNQTNLSDNLANGFLDGINSGDTVASAPLESRLLMLSDLPGVKVKSTLVPGASMGVSDLIVDVTPGPRISGSIDADNAGNYYTGEYRAGATVNLNNPTGHGDVASLRVLTAGTGLNYARASYQMQFGKAKAGVAYSWLDYALGKEFENLGAHGTAKVASIYGSYPLMRSRYSNLSVGLVYDDKTFQDKVDSSATVTDKKAHVLMSSIYGDHHDKLGGGGGGVSDYSLTWSAGNIDIQTPAARSADAVTAQSNGNFHKLGFNAMRLQRVTDSVSLYAALNGQIASKNLDSSEKMELGGMYAVRAYPEGEAFADQGYVMTLEARLLLPKPSPQVPGQMQLIGFVDTGSVWINKNPWSSESNSRTLSGAGVGFVWAETNNFMLKMYYAHKLGNDVATSAPDKSGRFWIQGVKYF